MGFNSAFKGLIERHVEAHGGSGDIPVAPKALFLAKLTWYPRIEVDLGVVAQRRFRPLLGLSDPLGH
jgi:hypothetical protein